MRPGWMEERSGLWTWARPGGAALVELHAAHVEWYVANPTGETLGEGWIPFTDLLEPEAVAMTAGALYAEQLLPVAAVEDAELRERVLNTCLRPLAGRWEALGLLRGRVVVANAVGWLRDAEAAVVVARRGTLELVAAWRQDGEVCWYGGRLS